MHSEHTHSIKAHWSALSLLASKKRKLIFLLVFSTAIYLPILYNGLVWDAELIVINDPRLRDLHHAFDYFYQGLWAFDAGRGVDYYRPIVGLLHTVEYSLFGTNPLGYNTVNLLLNTGVCLLAYRLLTILLPPQKAFWGAVIYASLPIRAEVVYWTYSDSHLLVAIFILLSIISFLNDRQISSLLFFALALLSQEGAVVMPAVILIIALHKKSIHRHGRYILIHFAGMLVYLAIRTLVLGSGYLKSLTTIDPELILYLLAKHLKILFIQDATITIYAQNPHTLPEFMPFTVTGAVLLIGIIALTVFSLKKNHQSLIWIAWFLLLMVPAFLVGKTGQYYMAEKILFLSSLGIVVLLINAIKTPNRLIIPVIVLIVITNSYLTFTEGKYWKSTATYLEKCLEFDSTFMLGLAAAGDAFYVQGDYDNALKYYKKLQALNPWHPGAHQSIRRIEKIKRTQPQN